MRGPVMMVAVAEPPAGVRLSPEKVEFDGGTPRLIPFFQVKDEYYTTYVPRL
jgi:hypothetical protein